MPEFENKESTTLRENNDGGRPNRSFGGTQRTRIDYHPRRNYSNYLREKNLQAKLPPVSKDSHRQTSRHTSILLAEESIWRRISERVMDLISSISLSLKSSAKKPKHEESEFDLESDERGNKYSQHGNRNRRKRKPGNRPPSGNAPAQRQGDSRPNRPPHNHGQQQQQAQEKRPPQNNQSNPPQDGKQPQQRSRRRYYKRPGQGPNNSSAN
jgi:hypothetical protein